MKKFLSLLLCALLFFALCIPGAAAADTADKYDWNTSADYYSRFKDDNITIDVYNWGDYISDGSDNDVNVNQLFTELTGIKVRYTNFASNEEMYAKIKSGGASYDVIIPSPTLTRSTAGWNLTRTTSILCPICGEWSG